MFKRNLKASLEELEIGATGPQELQLVLNASRHKVSLQLSAEEARWLATALNHWADESTRIMSH